MLITTFLLLVPVIVASDPPPVATTQPTDPRVVLGEGDAAFVRGDYDGALSKFESIPSDAGEHLAARVGLARCFQTTGQYEEASAVLTGVLERGKSSSDWLTATAEVEAVFGRYTAAIGLAERAVRIKPDNCRARFLLGQWYETVGKRDQAIETYKWFDDLFTERVPETAESLTYAARGFYRYSTLVRHPNLNRRTFWVLQEYLQKACERIDRTYWPAHLAIAELLREKYKADQALEDYEAVLKINKNVPQAYVGMGRIALDHWDFEQTEAHIEFALAINPKFVPALNLKAGLKLLERRYEEAISAAGKALAINRNDIDAISLMAAAYIRSGDEQAAEEFIERVASVNPKCARMHLIIGEALVGGRQFGPAERHLLKAIECEPADSAQRVELGLMYMQSGDEDKARRVLEAAWAIDEFNDRTYNVLTLLDSLEAYERCETEHFIIRYQAGVDAVLRRYVGNYLEGIYEEICDDYETHPARKTIIEVFPTHRAFGVRVTGRPWIHTVGACTGRVIATEAPRAGGDRMGPYHFARVLRHEFTHTVTLAATGNRIPHWFTEGLAVLQEEAPRSWRWMNMLAGAIRTNRLFSLDSIDWGFIRPERPGDRQLAYAQSEWMVEYIIATYGYDTINRLLEGFRAGKNQETVFSEVCGVSPDEFSKAFAQWALADVRRWGFDTSPIRSIADLKAELVKSPNDANVAALLAEALLYEGDIKSALEFARQALNVDENCVKALDVTCRAVGQELRALDDRLTERIEELQNEVYPVAKKLRGLAPKNANAVRLIGEIELARENYAAATEALKALQAIFPQDPSAAGGLAGIYLREGRDTLALGELEQVARTGTDDPEVCERIGGIYEDQGQFPDAAYWYLQSVYINPYDPDAHRDLARVNRHLGRHEQVINAYEALCVIEPESAGNWSELAFAYERAGDRTNATRCARRAVKLDAQSPAAALIKEP